MPHDCKSLVCDGRVGATCILMFELDIFENGRSLGRRLKKGKKSKVYLGRTWGHPLSPWGLHPIKQSHSTGYTSRDASRQLLKALGTQRDGRMNVPQKQHSPPIPRK